MQSKLLHLHLLCCLVNYTNCQARYLASSVRGFESKASTSVELNLNIWNNKRYWIFFSFYEKWLDDRFICHRGHSRLPRKRLRLPDCTWCAHARQILRQSRFYSRSGEIVAGDRQDLLTPIVSRSREFFFFFF